MDNNLPEVEIHEKKNYTVILIIILLFILVLGGWYTLSKQKSENIVQIDTPIVEDSQQSELVKSITMEGTIASIDPIKNELSINVSSVKDSLLSVASTDVKVKDRIVKVTKGTVIQKLVIAKDTDGAVNKSGAIEMNIFNLNKDDKVSISYNGLIDDRELSNVQNISLVINTDNFDQTYQSETEALVNQAKKISYVKGKVLSVSDTKIEYSPYALGELGSNKYSLVIDNDTKIYSLADSSRISIEHARNNATVGDIKTGNDIYIAVDENKEISQGISSSDSIIVISK